MAYKSREDAREYARKHYKANAETYKARTRERNRAHRRAVLDAIRLAKDRPCADCGIEYPHYVMQFDHLPEHEKGFTISHSTRRHVTMDALAREMEKCEVVCANCHAKRTYKRKNPDL